MKRFIAKSLLFVVVVPLAAIAGEQPAKRGSPSDAIKIRLPKDGYTFTRDEVAKGVKVAYSIEVAEDFESVVPSKTAPSYAERAGQSGLCPLRKSLEPGTTTASVTLEFPTQLP